MYLFIPINRSNSSPYQACQNISLHCTTSGFSNRYTPLLSVFRTHCCPLIKMRSPSSVDKKPILPLPLLPLMSPSYLEVKKVKQILWTQACEAVEGSLFIPGRTSAPGQKARTTLRKGSAAPDWQDNSKALSPTSPSCCQHPSSLHLLATSTESQRPQRD